ncbi:MAG: DoxX protein [Chloroflexi bacterium]|nr:DoxX protein [Chloroflexota bacterium]OJV89936.1 MAG: hypothetical protein BGO39_34385 [Chloroflexi bacterium 54-19]
MRTRKFVKGSLILLAVFGLVNLPGLASAHEKWFVDDPNGFKVDLGLIFSWPVAIAVAVSAVAVALVTWLDRQYQKRVLDKKPARNNLAGIPEERLQKLYGFLPMLLAFHVAVPLLVNGFQLQLFAPNLKMTPSLLSGALSLAEFLIALALVYGVFTDIAALGLIGLYVAGLVLGPFIGIPPVFLLEHLLVVGIAFFLYVFGRGPFSVDALLGRTTHPNRRMVRYAIPIIRWTTGLSLIMLSLTEKLLNPSLAEYFLTHKIDFNLGGGFGINDLTFTYIAGITEFLFGALLISGALPRLVIMIAWVPFNLTLPFLGWLELAGHLPVYGIMLVLLILGPTQKVVAERSAVVLARQTGALPEKPSKAKPLPGNVETA